MLLLHYLTLPVLFLCTSLPVTLGDPTSAGDTSIECKNMTSGSQAPLLADCQSAIARIPNNSEQVIVGVLIQAHFFSRDCVIAITNTTPEALGTPAANESPSYITWDQVYAETNLAAGNCTVGSRVRAKVRIGAELMVSIGSSYDTLSTGAKANYLPIMWGNQEKKGSLRTPHLRRFWIRSRGKP
ncbi:MAG: hypothetical protein L6R39_003853 [Caloplaca ligustica]|nr:MAG: hypothetical protein L6R39_003853 [Caloplaca ligustica]